MCTLCTEKERGGAYWLVPKPAARDIYGAFQNKLRESCLVHGTFSNIFAALVQLVIMNKTYELI